MYRVRRLRSVDRDFVTSFLGRHRLSETVFSRGHLHAADSLPGFVAFRDSDPVGLLVYAIADDGLEILVFHTTVDRIGLGSALIREAKKAARKNGCRRLWLVVTNDDTRSLGFYQRNGFRMVAFYPEARDAARALSPEIPVLGEGGIPVHDEIELELPLHTPAADSAAL